MSGFKKINVEELSKKKCVPCEGGVKSFTKKKAQEYLKMTRDWELLASQGNALEATNDNKVTLS